MAAHVWNLRSQRSFTIIHRALEQLRERTDLRIAHFSTQGNHIHLIVEANGEHALANGIRALAIRLARGLNRMMGRRGPVFEDRYHAHVLKTPAEVRNAVRYVLGNFASHAARWGLPAPANAPDPFSSAMTRAPWLGQRSLWDEPVTVAPAMWLLRGTSVR